MIAEEADEAEADASDGGITFRGLRPPPNFGIGFHLSPTHTLIFRGLCR
jgi:hypothetical protein